MEGRERYRVPDLWSGHPRRVIRQIDQQNLDVRSRQVRTGAHRRDHFAVVVLGWWNRLRRGVDDSGEWVIVQVRSDAGQIGHHVDADSTQVLGWPDAGKQQELGGPDRTGAEYRLGLGVDLPGLAADRVLNGGATATGHDKSMNQRTGHHGEVRAVEDGAQVSVSSRLAVPVHDVQIPPADALLVLSIEIVTALVSDAHCGIEEGTR